MSLPNTPGAGFSYTPNPDFNGQDSFAYFTNETGAYEGNNILDSPGFSV